MEEAMVNPTYRGNIWSTPQPQLIDWRLYLTEMEEDPRLHIEQVDMIREAQEGETVEIFITCAGGYVTIADMYVSAIRDSKAQVITRAIGECASAATTVFLAGDVRLCDDGSYFMFHNPQIGGGGDAATVFGRNKFYEGFFKEKYGPEMGEVLTEEELAELFERAGEIYLTAEEMRKRLEAADACESLKGTTTEVVDLPGGGKGTVILLPSGTRFGPESAVPTPPAEKLYMVGGNGDQVEIDVDQLVGMPYPLTTVPKASDFEDDSFEIALDSGFCKTFSLSRLCVKDFDEYNMDEIEEIGEVFDSFIGRPAGLTRQQSLEGLIHDIRTGSVE